MCKKTNYKSCNVRIDKCMRGLIKFLSRDRYLVTLACCCGHSKRPMTVVVKNKHGLIYELMSSVVINRVKRFYKRDKQGYFYIPEVEEYYKQIERKQYLQPKK